MDLELLTDGPKKVDRTIALAHGAGAAMDTPFMNYFVTGLADLGFRVVRFEFPYMAAKRETGRSKPPDRSTPVVNGGPRVSESLQVSGRTHLMPGVSVQYVIGQGAGHASTRTRSAPSTR